MPAANQPNERYTVRTYVHTAKLSVAAAAAIRLFSQDFHLAEGNPAGAVVCCIRVRHAAIITYF